MVIHLFVYGTLMKGHNNCDFTGLSSQKRIGKATTYGHFALTDGGFPFMFRSDELDQNCVVGELWCIQDEDVLAEIDLLEGVDDEFYNRERLSVSCNGMLYSCSGDVASEKTVKNVAGFLPLCPTNEYKQYYWR